MYIYQKKIHFLSTPSNAVVFFCNDIGCPLHLGCFVPPTETLNHAVFLLQYKGIRCPIYLILSVSPDTTPLSYLVWYKMFVLFDILCLSSNQKVFIFET